MKTWPLPLLLLVSGCAASPPTVLTVSGNRAEALDFLAAAETCGVPERWSTLPPPYGDDPDRTSVFVPVADSRVRACVLEWLAAHPALTIAPRPHDTSLDGVPGIPERRPRPMGQ